MLPSKTDHIMSRYRPIAPKPVAKGEGADQQADSHSLSTDKSSAKTGGKKRSKRGENSAAPQQQQQAKRARNNVVEFQPNLTPIFSDRVAPVFGPGGLQRFKDSFDHGGGGGGGGVSVSLSLSAKSPPREPFPRAAAPRCSKDGLSFNIGSEFTPASTESEVCSAEDAPDSTRKPNIVTLSLLPDAPLLASTRSSSSSSTLSLLRSDIRWPPATTSSDLNTSLTMSSGRRCEPDALRHDADARVVDAHYLEQRHGGSSEAVMLTDEMDAVLWVNSAFKRLSTERMMTRMQAIGPHIDPLGIRTHLASLMFQPQFPAPKCKATLWGFLKKFVLPEAVTGAPEGAPLAAQAAPAPPAPPARPPGSTITVQTIVTMDARAAPLTEPLESVQARLDEAEMPSVVTDAKFRVRWANAAYKRLVGDAAASVTLDAAPPLLDTAAAAAAFTCRVRIQWSYEGEHSAMSVPSEVMRLDDAAAGALFVWGFDVCDAGVRNVLQIDAAADATTTTISPFC